MPKILFVCHGNICRSPMAEYVLKHLVAQRGQKEDFTIASAATSTEEIGNPVHRGTKRKLSEVGIPMDQRSAVQLRKSDYHTYDYLIGMDSHNIRNMLRILGGDPEKKVYRLLDFTSSPRDIADPWYTGNFDITYHDIMEGCTSLLEQIGAARKGNRH
ncbi:MAG: low molecular weight phosphotyrosine protein phosphatase [Ruminococcaceae bacterium]|nr:low molecular weight phosphotyrosine protein phosphatase [Oscillospiraceae bacterium]